MGDTLKLNNKGFAISSIMYIILVLAVILIVITLSLLSSRKLILDKLKDEVIDNIKYSEILSTLKKEAITYATENSIEKESIKVEDINSTISSDVLEENNLYDKYLTMINNSGLYDVYLGSEKTLQGNDLYAKNIIDVINYKIGGNSVQSGEPSPDTPKEIQSVGDKTTNMADLSKCVLSTSTPNTKFSYDNSTGTLELTSTPSIYDYVMLYVTRDLGIELEEGKTYYYGADVTVSGKTTTDRSTILFTITHDNGSVGYGQNFYENTTQNIKRTFTYTKDMGSIRLNMHFNYGSEEAAHVKYENIYFGEVDEYEPLYDGYIIQVKSSGRGKNLLNPKTVQDVNQYIDCTSGGTRTPSATSDVWRASDYIEVSSGKTYHFNANNVDGSMAGIAWYDKNKTYISGISATNMKNANGNITAPSNASYVRLSWTIGENNNSNWKNTLQFEEGSVETNYEPYVEPITTNIYLDEPIRKVGDYTDYIDFKNQKIIRNVGKKTLDGTESWTSNAFGENNLYYTYITDMVSGTRQNFLSNLFTTSKNGSSSDQKDNSICFGYGNSHIYTRYNSVSTLEEFKTYLSDNNLEIEYGLGNIVEEAIALPRIGVNPNAPVLSVDTKVAPTNVEFTVIEKIKKL